MILKSGFKFIHSYKKKKTVKESNACTLIFFFFYLHFFFFSKSSRKNMFLHPNAKKYEMISLNNIKIRLLEKVLQKKKKTE